ncbi:hypothetical protein M9Y10_035191 [Tritrichomonas musculus]|uniref:Spindle assembly abnormal protein 6 N-terminal domain-containing protein n=1 Tax=Tritrichomonas musculus TaxID=1915356 RepID=A0ABR2KH06_9EUKA
MEVEDDIISHVIGDPSLQFQIKNDNDEAETLFYEIFYDNEISLDFRNSENHETLDRVVRLRVMTYKEDTILKQMKFEILDDSDLYYFVESILNEEKFDQLKKENQLNIDFDSFPDEIRFMLDDSQTTGGETKVIFIEENDGSGIMQFSQALDLKSVEVLKLNFDLVDPEFIQKQVQYRFDQMRAFLDKNKAILAEFNRQMQSKSPILLKSINNPSRTPRKFK